MYWLVAVAIIDLLSFGHAQKYDTSGAITLDVSPTATTSCGGCNIDVHNFGFEWHDQAYTHVAATIVKFVNNATNVTITSTVQGDVYTLPAGAVAGAALVVSDSVITTVIGGTLYTLTYPKRYMGVGGIERYSQTPIINGNRTVKCVVSKTAMTHPFLLREDVSNGLELSAFINRDIDRNCALLGASPPRVLVRVSSLTATTTNYINPLESRTSATNVASPAVTPGSPTAPQTASPTVSDLPTVLANPSARKTADSLIATKSTSSKPTPIGSVDLASPATISSGFSVAGNTLTRDVGISSSQREPQAASSIVSDRPTVLASLPAQETADSLPIATESPPSETNILLRVSPATPRMLVPVESTLPVTISSLPPIAVNTQTRIPAVKISYTGVALDPPDTVVGSRTSKLLSSVPSDYAGIIGSRTIALPSYPSLPVIDVVTATPTEFLVDGVTLAPNGPLVTVSGTPISLGSSDLVIGTSTFELPAEPTVFAVDGQKFTAVDRIENHRDDSSITVRGTPVLLEPSGVVIGSKTIALPSHLSFPVLTVGGKPLTANPTGFVVGSVTLSPNGPLATVSGTPISLGSSNLVIGTSTIELPAEPSVFTVDGQKFTVKPPDFAVGSTEIHRDDSSITVRGTPVLLEPSGVVIGSKTIALPSSLSFPVLTVGGKPLTANPTGFVVGSVTVSPNGPLVTVSGTPISLGSSDLVIGTSTFELPAEPTVFAVDGQKFTAVDRIENHRDDSSITVRGTPVLLEPSGVVIGSKTIALPSHLSFPVLTVGGKPLTANPTGFVVGSVTLSPNGPLATVSGTPISLGSSNLVIGTSTIELPAEPSVFTVDGQKFTVKPPDFAVGSTEIHRDDSSITVRGTPVLLEPSGVVIGSKTIALPSSLSFPVLTVGGKPLTANPTGFVVGSVTVSPNGPLVTVSGTPISLGSSDLVIGTSTFELPAEPTVFAVDGQKFTAVDRIENHRDDSSITVRGTPVMLEPSGIVIGSKTIALPSHLSFPVLTVGGKTFTANPTEFVVGSVTLSPNGPLATISGTPISLGSSNLVIGTSTIDLPAEPSVFTVDGQPLTVNPSGFSIGGSEILRGGSPVTISGKSVSFETSGISIATKTRSLSSSPSLPVLKVAGISFTANPTGFHVGSVTLSPNGPLATISGTPISLGSSNLVIGNRTIDLPAESSVFTVDGQALTANPSGLSIGGTEIHRGGSPVTISGTPISLGSSALIVGSSTVPLPSLTKGLGPAILSGLGIAVTPTASAGTAAGNGTELFTGTQIKIEAPMILLTACVALTGLI